LDSNPMLMNERFTAAFPSLIRALDGDVLTAVVLQAVNYRAAITEADPVGEVWVLVTISKIADEIGISVPQAKRALTKLRDLGWVSSRNAEGYQRNLEWRIHYDQFGGESKVRNRTFEGTDSDYLRDGIGLSSSLIEIEISSNKSQTINSSQFPQEAQDLAHLLADLITANGSKKPNVTDAWIKEIDLMHRKDCRSWEQIEGAIRWSQADPFWRANILSPRKLREKYDQLRLSASRSPANNYEQIQKTLNNYSPEVLRELE